MAKLYLVRHGETEENRNSRFCGWTDAPLNELGRLQAQKVAAALKDVELDAIYTSNLKRAKETASYIKEYNECIIYEVEQLKELNFGKVEGLTIEEIKQNHPDIYSGLENDYIKVKFPSGESLEEMHHRVVMAVDKILQDHQDENILLVAHSGVIRSIIAHLLTGDITYHWNFKVEHCSISTIEYHENFSVLTKLNDMCHF
ncbi:MAG: alpha-ribazole phosphatase [Clostridiaceae bacterium]|nr:alpha-ribazole phosphatase [Clostridiaceae bacterium]